MPSRAFGLSAESETVESQICASCGAQPRCAVHVEQKPDHFDGEDMEFFSCSPCVVETGSAFASIIHCCSKVEGITFFPCLEAMPDAG